MKRRTWVATLTLAWVVGGRSVLAGSLPAVKLDIDPCLQISEADVRHLVEVELGPSSAPQAEGASFRTRVTCVGNLAQLTLDPPSGGRLERTLDLEEARRARPRLLALALVELISASLAEAETARERQRRPPAPAREEPRPAEKVAARVVAPSPLMRLRLMGLGGGLSFFSGTGVLGGGGLRVAKNHRRGIGWIGDVQAQHSSVTLALGSVSVDVLSVAAALAYHHEWGRLGLQVGGGLRGGAVRLSGEPTSMQAALGHSGWGAWGGVMGVANLSVIATRRLVFDLGVEVGYVFLPAAGLVSQRREVAVDGAWIGFQLGIGIFL